MRLTVSVVNRYSPARGPASDPLDADLGVRQRPRLELGFGHRLGIRNRLDGRQVQAVEHLLELYG